MDQQQRYQDKADFFDEHARSPWSADPYGPQELQKLQHLFGCIGSLAGKQVLEPGCGTGRLTRILAEQVGPKGRVLACDISPIMLSMASDQVQDFPQARVVSSQVEDLQVEPNTFDVVMCHQVFPHLENQQACLDRFAELLKPQGQLVIHHLINWDQINDVHRKAGTAVERDIMPSDMTLKSMLAQAGFEVQWLYDNQWGYGVLSVNTTCG